MEASGAAARTPSLDSKLELAHHTDLCMSKIFMLNKHSFVCGRLKNLLTRRV
jgi:hypothetical protein